MSYKSEMAEPGNPGFVLSFEQRADYLYAFVTGENDSISASCQFFEAIYLKAIELGSQKILIEEDFPNQLMVFEIFQLAEYLAETVRTRAIFAVVDRDVMHLELNRFLEMAAGNRGLTIRVFNSVEEAESWLMG